ncbi:MAG: hypothetical protein IKC46_15035 [Lachnospiraceae bacterium]|nr:hypothetical protein [Lachnospiraceae bacterium]
MEQKGTIQQNWFKERKWGVFVHYLASVQNKAGDIHNTAGQSTDWNSCVEELDTDLLAEQLAQINAGYLIFTVMQGTRYVCAPNETYDQLAGFSAGEAASRRDLIADLIRSLDKYDIPLFLYYTGDGPHLDPYAMKGLYGKETDITPAGDHVTPAFAEKWAAVMEEYALRYGDKIKGWWVDGLYPSIGYDDPELIKLYKDAARKGNPNALFSANYYGCFACNGREKEVAVPGIGNVIFADFYNTMPPSTPFCDFTAGEVVHLDAYPQGQILDGAQAHILSFLGIPKHPVEVYNGWGALGCKYSSSYLQKYVKQVNDLGGVVSLDVCMYRDGRIDEEQMEVLKNLVCLRENEYRILEK